MTSPSNTISTDRALTLTERIREIGLNLGFQAVRFSAPSTEQHRKDFDAWIAQNYHGEMDWLARNADKRFNASALHPGTQTVIAVRMDYWPNVTNADEVLNDPTKAYVSRYALGRDYHKVLRKRLSQFAEAITVLAGDHGYRPFVDSAPLMERQIAEQAGMGWIGKNALMITPGHGSWFFLGELCTDLKLDYDPPLATEHCGSCEACLVECPTDAFVSEGVLDARRCISYLTIEFDGIIPEELREKMGNRIYGCDDCQLVCPHNRKAPSTKELDFSPRHQLDNASLLSLLEWDEATFLKNTEGSPIRRIGYAQWTRNLSIALGNGPASTVIIEALKAKLGRVSNVVDTHLHWAIDRLERLKNEG